jgi:hypothetical protein
MSLSIIAARLRHRDRQLSLTLLGHPIRASSFAPHLALMIGLGVDIEYTRFIAVRCRPACTARLSPEYANVLALTTPAWRCRSPVQRDHLLARWARDGHQPHLQVTRRGGRRSVIRSLVSITRVPAITGYAGTPAARLEGASLACATRCRCGSRQIQNPPWLGDALSLALRVTSAVPMFSLRLAQSTGSARDDGIVPGRVFDLAKGFGSGFQRTRACGPR